MNIMVTPIGSTGIALLLAITVISSKAFVLTKQHGLQGVRQQSSVASRSVRPRHMNKRIPSLFMVSTPMFCNKTLSDSEHLQQADRFELATELRPFDTGVAVAFEDSGTLRSEEVEQFPFYDQPTSLTTATAATIVQQNRPSSKAPTLNTWKKRLISKTDKLSSHKISGASLTLSGLLIIAVGSLNGFQEVPSFLEPITIFYVAAMFLQMVTSFSMASIHRRSEPQVRNVFMNVGLSCFLLAYSAYYTAPFESLSIIFDHNAFLSKAPYAMMSVIGLSLVMDAFVNFGSLLKSQMNVDRRIDATDTTKMVRALGSIVPYLFSLPFYGFSLYFMGYLMDRPTLMTLVYPGADLTSTLAINYYLAIAGAWGLSLGPLFVTLRDKQLISKGVEVSLTLLTSMPVICCLGWQFNLLIAAGPDLMTLGRSGLT